MRPCSALLIFILCCSFASAQSRTTSAPSKKPPVTCASCHRTQTSTQPGTQMGRAMQVPGDNPDLSTHPKLTFRNGAYSYSVETHNGQSQYIVSDGTHTISLPILWAMGAQAQTWVVEHDGQMYESLVSYYPTMNGLFITVGDDQMSPKTLEEAIGRPLSADDAKTCFGCHSTNAIVDHKLNLASLTPGLTCAHCHTGTVEHLDSKIRGDKDAVDPPSLADLSTEDVSNFCGGCHRSWELVVRAGWKGTSNVRFQPYRLANSKCFNGADPRISCIACHDPHQKVDRNVASYDSKCLACHATSLEAAASTTSPNAKSCPVAKANCTSCHMPKVPFPGGHFVFTDHQIRVVRPNEAYPN
jgi:nitrate/TMAO reductase-like tetraheme cytochrome c subunit